LSAGRACADDAAMPFLRAVRLAGLACFASVALVAQHDAPIDATKKPGPSAPAPLTDAKDKTPSDFARFVAQDTGGHFDVAITTYRNDAGVTVRLFGAVHIADAAHYVELQRRFTQCERLLYELVGPEDYRPKKGEARGGFVSILQQGMKNGLELEFQLDGIDYGVANFVHADMTPEEFEDSMAERGESVFSMLMQVGMNAQKKMAESQAAADDGDEDDEDDASRKKPVDMAKAFRDGEGRHQLRLMMAQQLEALEAASSGSGSTLLEGRNEKCLQVLQREIAAGSKDLGIYYGAAHLPHMEQRLTQDLGFAKVDHEWLVAWDCTKRPDPKVDRELWRQRRLAKGELDSLSRAVKKFVAAQEDDSIAPTFEQIEWTGSRKDPWGGAYAIAVVDGIVDVHSLGQDGKANTDDDLHTASVKERGEMERKLPAGK
jgi:hypothetical protein